MVKHCSRNRICEISKHYGYDYKCKCQDILDRMNIEIVEQESSKQISMTEYYLINETPKHEMENKDVLI